MGHQDGPLTSSWIKTAVLIDRICCPYITAHQAEPPHFRVLVADNDQPCINQPDNQAGNQHRVRACHLCFNTMPVLHCAKPAWGFMVKAWLFPLHIMRVQRKGKLQGLQMNHKIWSLEETLTLWGPRSDSTASLVLSPCPLYSSWWWIDDAKLRTAFKQRKRSLVIEK